MKKVICTILAMVTLSTSVCAAENVKTFNGVVCETLNGAAFQKKTVITENMKYTEYDNYMYVFGVEVTHTRYRSER